MVTKKDILQTGENFPLLGWCLHWTTAQFDIKFDDFVLILEQCGINPRIAKKTLARNAFIRSMKTNVKNVADDGFHRRIAEKDEEMAMAIIDSKVDEDDYQVQFSTPTTAVFDKANKTLEVKGQKGDVIEQDYNAFRDMYSSKQFRTVVLRFIKRICEGVTMREGGGIYFVSRDKSTELAQLETLFSHFKGCSIDLIPIVDTKKARKSMWKCAVGEIKTELSKFQMDLSELPVDAPDRMVESRLEKFQALKEKVEMYETVLSGTASELSKELDKLTTSLRARLTA